MGNSDTYGAEAEPLVFPLPVMLMKRMSSTFGKKSLSGKESSESSAFAAKRKKAVVACSAPQKPYRPSPIQDSKRQGSGGLLSQPAVHAARRDGGRTERQRNALERQEAGVLFRCVF